MSRAPWVLPQARSAPTPRGHRDAALDHASAGGLVNPRTARGRWTALTGREHREARRRSTAGRPRASRTRSPLESHRRAAAAWDDGSLRGRDRPGARRRPLERDESIRPGTTLEKLAGPEAGLRRRRHRHRRQRLAAQRRRRRWRCSATRPAPAARPRPAGAGSSAAAPRRSTPTCFGLRPRRRPPGEALRRGRHRLGRPGRRRAERGVRRPVAGLPEAAGPTWTRPIRQRPRRRDRDRPPARRLRTRISGALARQLRTNAAAAGAWPRSASASDRDWRSSCTPDGTDRGARCTTTRPPTSTRG